RALDSSPSPLLLCGDFRGGSVAGKHHLSCPFLVTNGRLPCGYAPPGIESAAIAGQTPILQEGMMKFRRAAALALGLSFLAGTGQAQTMMGPDSGTYGWYLRGEGGWNHMSDLTAHANTGAQANSTEGEGYILGGAVGYGFGQWRTELNIDYRHNDVKSLAIAGAATSGSGSVDGTSFMGNFLFDLPFNWS